MFALLVQTKFAKDAPYAWFLFDLAKQNSRYYLPDFREQAESVEAYLDAFVVALQAGETTGNWLDRDIGAVAFYQKDDHPVVQIQLLHWLGEHRAKEQLAWIQQYYTHDNQTIAFAAVCAGFLLNDGTAKLETYALQENLHMLQAASLILIKENNPDILGKALGLGEGADQVKALCGNCMANPS